MDIQQTLITLLQNYWGVLVVVLGFGVYAIFQRQQAKKIILGLMLQLEKEAETLALATGDAKFEFLVDKGYQLLPQGARIFITPTMFKSLAQNLYDGAKKLVQQYLHNETEKIEQTIEPTIPEAPQETVQSVQDQITPTTPTQQ